jgi:integrase
MECIVRFTTSAIKSLKPKAERYEKWETGRKGFGIRVAPGGRKTWVYLFRFEGKPRRMSLGTFPQMGLSAAHTRHAKAAEKLERGADPGAELVCQRKAEREAETVADLANEYIERYARKEKRSGDQDERTIARDIIPALGTRKAKDVSRRDIIQMLDKIEGRGSPVMRNRTASLISKLFVFGLDRGIVTASPAVGIKALKEKPRNVILTPEQIHFFWHGLDTAKVNRRTALALRLTLVTGQRRGEVAGIPRAEIDDAERLWNLPGERTKNQESNIVPLPPLAMRIIAEADKLRVKPHPVRPHRKDRKPYDPTPSPWLFPSPLEAKPIEANALTRAVNRNHETLGSGYTVHDLRRTFATAHGEIGTAPEILSALLNHTPSTLAAKVYNKAKNLQPRREAMERWCEYLELIIYGKFVLGGAAGTVRCRHEGPEEVPPRLPEGHAPGHRGIPGRQGRTGRRGPAAAPIVTAHTAQGDPSWDVA